MLRVGSRAQVMHGNAKQTSGGLMKKDMKYNKHGKIVSKKMSQIAKKEKRLENAGYITQKGVFGAKKNISGGQYINFQLEKPSRRLNIKQVRAIENKQNAIYSIQNKIFNSKNSIVINSFLDGLKNKTIKRLERFGSFNPNNEIYIDKTNNRVYKFGLWNDRFRCIKNEFIAYSLLNATSNNSDKKHFPKLYDCVLIPDTHYALLVIEYKEDLKQYNYVNKGIINESNKMNINNSEQNNLNENEKSKLYNETVTFLRRKGMVNEDLEGNLYYYTKDNKNIFYCIDFEEVEFKNNNNKKLLYKNMDLPINAKQKIEDYNNKLTKKNNNNSSVRFGKVAPINWGYN